MEKKSIGEYKCVQAVALYDAGFTISSVARQLNISWICFKNAIIRHRNHGTFKDPSRTGRPLKLRPRTAHHLKRLVHGKNRANANIITQKLNGLSIIHVSSRTVRRHLHKMEYTYSAQIKKSYLKKIHKMKRIA
ncbi:unnamed protein product [Rotaria sordida]|uniref:Transposase Tc1-like domain-containing protein n=2 Tax=Rotaria sordida TaxID=392033 RepID=A0A815SVE2_9BILA|nr:unnamed protein product [Rotaria sordida]CAF1518729.1 unnamed protein product [Rotaria sordida]CAF4164816.1 unnamed protein product [Rotaria sordida]